MLYECDNKNYNYAQRFSKCSFRLSNVKIGLSHMVISPNKTLLLLDDLHCSSLLLRLILKTLELEICTEVIMSR